MIFISLYMLTCNTEEKGELQKLYLNIYKFINIVKATFSSKGPDCSLINLEDTNYNIKGMFILPIFPLLRTINILVFSTIEMALVWYWFELPILV